MIDDLRAIVSSVADASQLLLVVTDADGIILWRDGAARVRHRADTPRVRRGRRMDRGDGRDERDRDRAGRGRTGATVLGRALRADQHPWYCTAAPIHDPRTGELLGIVDVSGPAITLHPTIIALVETAVRLAESQLWRHHELRLERLRQAAAPMLASATGPLLLVDDHGWVAHTTGVAARDRIAVPRESRR